MCAIYNIRDTWGLGRNSRQISRQIMAGRYQNTGSTVEKTAPLDRKLNVQRVVALLAVAWVFLTDQGFGQGAPDRYQLGRRLERFERAWQQASGELRAKCTPSMEQAVQSFFSLQLSRAGKSLDEAWLQVTGVQSAEQAQRLQNIRWKLDVDGTLLDLNDPILRCRAGVFYDQQLDANKTSLVLKVWPWNDSPAKVMLSDSGQAPLMSKTLEVVPEETFEVDFRGLPAGDYVLTAHGLGSDPGKFDWICPSVSLVDRPQERLAKMEAWADSNRKDSSTASGADTSNPPAGQTAKSTARFLAREIARGRKGTAFEIDLPWNKLINDFEQITEPSAPGERANGSFELWMRRAGWKWMQLSRGRSTQVVRIEVPAYEVPANDKKDSDKKLPVLIALHGAGGSENMFFQTYGAGRLVELGRDRQWIVVSPRQTMTGLGLDAQQIVEALSEYLPVDPERVMLVGHSMGAAQAMTQVSEHPESIRMVAALGGGGGVRDTEALRKVPFYVAAGDRDFGKKGAKSLGKQLQRIGCQVEYREYPDVEHMVIVQAALDDVFAFFDQRLK